MKISLPSRLATPIVLVALLAGAGLLAPVAVPAANAPASSAPAAAAAPAPVEIDPAALALARKYVDLTNKGELFPRILATTAKQTSDLLVPQNPDKVKEINTIILKVEDEQKAKGEELLNQIARIYAITFTTAELQQIVDFYSTPVGQKLAASAVKTGPAIDKVLRVFTYNFGTDFVTQVKAELKSAGITK